MRRWYLLALLFLLPITMGDSCRKDETTSAAGVQRAEASVSINPTTGMTVEQQNVAERLALDNAVGSIKHLYVISAMSGQVILYSTVRGKVTSSGKRLTPTTITDRGYNGRREGFWLDVGGNRFSTGEVLQDDGTYGSSIPYLYWWDAQGRYHQHYVSGGQIIHISDQPIRVPEIRINLSAEE